MLRGRPALRSRNEAPQGAASIQRRYDAQNASSPSTTAVFSTVECPDTEGVKTKNGEGTHSTLRLNVFTADAAGSLTARTWNIQKRAASIGRVPLCLCFMLSRTHQEDDAAHHHERPNHRANPYC